MNKSTISILFSIAVLLSFTLTPTIHADTLIEQNLGDVNEKRLSGDVIIGHNLESRMALDDNEIQSQSCRGSSETPDDCLNRDLYLQRFGGNVYVGHKETSHIIIANPYEKPHSIWFYDKQTGVNESVVLSFDASEPDTGLTIQSNSKSSQSEFNFKPNGVAKKVAGPLWGTLSDKRVKKNIKPFKAGLETISKIRPVTFRYNGLANTKNNQKRYVGVIAQEINEIDSISSYTIESTKIKLNDDDKNEADLLVFDSSALLFTSVNAIKELDNRLGALRESNAELEIRLDELAE